MVAVRLSRLHQDVFDRFTCLIVKVGRQAAIGADGFRCSVFDGFAIHLSGQDKDNRLGGQGVLGFRKILRGVAIEARALPPPPPDPT